VLDLAPGRSGFFIRTAFGDQDEVVIRDVYEDDCYRVAELPCLAKWQEGQGCPTVVDVGAHIGCFARRVLDTFPGAHVVCIEANPDNVPVLAANVGRRAEVIPAACTYEAGELAVYSTLHAEGLSTGGSFIASAGLDYSGWSNACEYRPLASPPPRVTLEEVMDRFDWGRIDVLKLDCEGSEWSILRQATCLDRVRVIVGEYHGELRHGQEHGETMFRRLVAERFAPPPDRADATAGWRVELLRGGEIGLFRLTNLALS
jgi:FkbM family methyltransferase